jgi:hypothetical protein
MRASVGERDPLFRSKTLELEVKARPNIDNSYLEGEIAIEDSFIAPSRFVAALIRPVSVLVVTNEPPRTPRTPRTPIMTELLLDLVTAFNIAISSFNVHRFAVCLSSYVRSHSSFLLTACPS